MHSCLLCFCLALLPLSLPSWAQEKATADQRQTLEQILIQTYQPSDVGKKLMGVGADTDIRRPGIIVVIQREGLYGSLIRSEIASSAIDGVQAKLYRGHQDYAVPVGERFYVTAIHVGSGSVNFGLLSARAVPAKAGQGRVWTAPTFNFPDEVLANADRDTVLRAVDSWFLPEGRAVLANPTPAAGVVSTSAEAAPSSGRPVDTSRSTPQPISAATANLTTGMSAEQVSRLIGQPKLTFHRDNDSLEQYPGLILKFENDKLTSVEPQANSSSATLVVQSNPPNAEIYVDAELVGATPSTLQIPAGHHRLTLKLAGAPEWSRDLNALPGSEIHFSPSLTLP